MRKNLLWGLFAAGLALNIGVAAQPELDSGFVGGGKSTIIYGSTAVNSDMVIQPDNKIVLSAPCFNINISSVPFCAVRLNADGGVDGTFKSGNGSAPGVYTKFPGTSSGEANGLALQSDGRVIMVGYVTRATEDVTMVRYRADGSVDTTFGTAGIVFTDIDGADRAEKVKVQPDGKILVVGKAGSSLFVARYLSNGTLDGTFGTGGVAKATVSGNTLAGRSLAIQSDGKIVAGGFYSGSYLAARFNADGTPDSTWDGDGIRTVPFGATSGSDGIRSLAIQPDGRVLAAGRGNVVFRFNTDGSLDNGFDGDGSREAFPGTGKETYSLTLMPDGRMMVAGMTITSFGSAPAPLVFFTSRYLSDGSADTSYSGDGYLEVDFSTSADGARSSAIDSYGRVVVGGMGSNCCVNTFWEQPVFSVMRISGPAIVPASFDITGRVMEADGRPVQNAILTTQDGRVARTNPFGYYRFSGVTSGQTYTVSVNAKNLAIANRGVAVGGQVTNFDFTGFPLQ